MFDVFRKIVMPIKSKRFEYYNQVEDKLYLEEFESPNQIFSISEIPQDHLDIQSKFTQKKIMTIN
jgi:hypothetical protein